MADYALCMTVYNVGVGTVVAKLLACYGLSLSASNLVVGMPGTLMFLELLGGYFYNRVHDGSRYIKAVSAAWRLCFPLVLLPSLLPGGSGVWLTVAFYGAMCVFYRLAIPGYNAWTVSGVAGCGDANFYSRRDFYFMILYTAMLFLSGVAVDSAERAGNIRAGFLGMAAGELVLIGLSFLTLFRMPAPQGAQGAHPASFFASLAQPVRDAQYRMVLRMNMVWNFVSAFVGGFIAVYQVQVLSVSYFDIVLWGMIANLVRIALIPVFSVAARRIGWKGATVVSLGLMLLSYLMWIPMREENQVWLFPVATILGAAPWAALGIGLFKYQILYTAAETRSSYFSVSSALSALRAAAGTACCSALVSVLAQRFEAPPFWSIFLTGALGVVLVQRCVWKTPYREP